MENKETWHLRKELNIGHIIATLTLASGIITWGFSIDNRITKAEVRIESMITLMAENRVDQKNMRDELMNELRYIRSRIDGIARDATLERSRN
jgi:hypothetical protein